MRRTTLGMLGLMASLGVSACGGSKHFANLPRPPAPVNLTVYVNDQRVSVSPSSVGAGPVVFIITNQASNAESLVVTSAGSSSSLADTGPISPQGTAQLTVDLKNPGQYTVGIAPNNSTEAAAATPTGIQSAVVRVGSQRPSSSNQVGQP
jgi:hypothetical protein